MKPTHYIISDLDYFNIKQIITLPAIPICLDKEMIKQLSNGFIEALSNRISNEEEIKIKFHQQAIIDILNQTEKQ